VKQPAGKKRSESEKKSKKPVAKKFGVMSEQVEAEGFGGVPKLIASAILLLVMLLQCIFTEVLPQDSEIRTLENVPEYTGAAYTILYDNQPQFAQEDLVTKVYEYYSELDELGRCGYTMACLGKAIMTTQERGNISHVKPSGWVQAQYDSVDGGSLYNRCHLIGWQLSGEDANKNNLITGTRYMNVEGMLPFENMVADYVKETGNHVVYRVTPVFQGEELIARGVMLEAFSVEDQGEGICFHVYVYNVQPGIQIDYLTGKSWEIN